MPESSMSDDVEPFDAAMIEHYRDAPDWKVYRALIEKAARAGDDRAAYAMATWYLFGNEDVGVRKHAGRGRAWLERAARSMALAMCDLALAHETGRLGLAVDERAAYRLYARAVEYGGVAARHDLGRCLYHGIGVRTDRARGLRLYAEARRLGYRRDDE